MDGVSAGSQFGAGVVRRAHGRGACTGEGAPRGFLKDEGGRMKDEVKAVSLSLILHPSAFIFCLKHPRVAARVVGEVAFGIFASELFVARVQALVAPVGGVNGSVRNLLQVALALPDVSAREAPVGVAELRGAR